jgi:hypothetical protein
MKTPAAHHPMAWPSLGARVDARRLESGSEPPEPGERTRRRSISSLGVGVCIGLAAVLSVLRKGYQFDGWYADDQVWNTLIVHRLHPEQLANDPLVGLIGDRYESGLLDLIVALAPAIEIYVASFAFFLVARLLACVAMYRLTLTLTRSSLAGIVSAFLLAGASISYFGGINFVETILTPRGFALPLALFALDAFLRRRLVAMTLWIAACLYVHPVSGINILGAIAFCGLVFPHSASRKTFYVALALLALEILGIAFWTGQLGGDVHPLRFDDAWVQVISETVGPWVFLHLAPPSFLVASVWMPFFGAIAVAAVGSRDLRTSFVRFALASIAALGLHALCVDLLKLRPLLQLSPQRATVALVAISVAAVAYWIAKSIRQPDPLRRMLGAAFLLAGVLLQDLSTSVLFGVLLALAWWLRKASIGAGWRAALAVALVGATLAITWPTALDSFHLSPERVAGRIAKLRALGLDDDWVAVQTYIRQHSEVGDVVMAPPALSPRVFARRPSALRLKMQSFTHVSRPFAFAFMDWRREVGIPMQTAGTAEAIEIARRTGARWLVLDDGDTPPEPGDPAPDFRAGPYRAFSLEPAEPPPARDGSAGNPSAVHWGGPPLFYHFSSE